MGAEKIILNVGGAQKLMKKEFGKVNGAWVEVKKEYAKVNGVAKIVFVNHVHTGDEINGGGCYGERYYYSTESYEVEGCGITSADYVFAWEMNPVSGHDDSTYYYGERPEGYDWVRTETYYRVHCSVCGWDYDTVEEEITEYYDTKTGENFHTYVGGHKQYYDSGNWSVFCENPNSSHTETYNVYRYRRNCGYD